MSPEEALGLLKAVAELERRIVKLEAYMRAARDERRLVRHQDDLGEQPPRPDEI